MKKKCTTRIVYLSGLLLLKVSLVYSQITIPGPAAQWNNSSFGGDPFGDPCWPTMNYSITPGTDSLVDGHTYTLLRMMRTTYYTENAVTGQICTSDTVNIQYGTIGGIRNDGAKVYLREFNNGLEPLYGSGIPDGVELLLYDFSANVGDIIPITKMDGALSYDSVVYIENTTLADGLLRKYMQVHNSIDGSHKYYEGIGDFEYGLFGSLQYMPFESGIVLNCYKEDGLYLLGAENCDLFDPVVTINETQIAETPSIWPNPATSQLHVELQTGNAILTIYTLEGKQAMTALIENTAGNIDIQTLPAGLYLVDIYYPNGQHALSKIQKL